MDENELLEIKQLIEKRLEEKTGLDFVVIPKQSHCSFNFAVDLIFRRYSTVVDTVCSDKETYFSSTLERDIDTILYSLTMDLQQITMVLKERLGIWE